MLAGSAFEDPGTVALLKRFTPILVDGDAHDEALQRYSVRGFPTVVFCDPAGRELGRVLGAPPPDEFRRRAQAALDSL